LTKLDGEVEKGNSVLPVMEEHGIASPLISLNGKLKFLYAENGNKLRLGATLDIEKHCFFLFRVS